MQLTTGSLIDDLKRWQKAYRNNMLVLLYSKNTIELYTRAIERLIEYSLQYKDEVRLDGIQSSYFNGYLLFLEEKAKRDTKRLKNNTHLSISTKQLYLKAIKSFFSFISDNNNELFNFKKFFSNIKVLDNSPVKEKIVYLTEDEVERLLTVLEDAKVKKDDYNSNRNALLVKLMLYSGLRISEALNISLRDFVSIRGSELYNIKIHKKEGKEQTAYLVKNIIDDELDYFRTTAKLDNDTLIMKTGSGRQLERTNAYQIINTIYKKTGIQKGGLDLLRHTLAMRLTRMGATSATMQKILRRSGTAYDEVGKSKK